MKNPTVYDVAARAGVSTATVSRYFRAPEKLREPTRDLVARAVSDLGYLPSGAAQGLAARRTGVIGLYSFSGHEPDELDTPAEGDPDRVAEVRDDDRRPRLFPLFADEVLRGVELECTLRGVPLALGWHQANGEGVALDAVARRVDGLLVLPDIVDRAALAQLARQRALVLIAGRPARGVSAGSVSVANAPGMRAVVNHLGRVHGCRRFWYVGPKVRFDGMARWQGAREGFDDLDVPDAVHHVPTSSRGDTKAALARSLSDHDPPEAVVCASDQAALGALEALADVGLADVAVTGFDGIDAGALVSPGLTTVRQPMEAVGRVGVALLLEQLNGAAPREVVLPVELVIRESCGCS